MTSHATVDVRLFAAARAAVGCDAVSASPGTLGSVLDEVQAAYPQFSAVRMRCSYLLDGLACGDLEAAVREGSQVDVLPPFAGG